MAKSNPKREEKKKQAPQQEDSKPAEEKEQRGILPEDIDFRRGMGCG